MALLSSIGGLLGKLASGANKNSSSKSKTKTSSSKSNSSIKVLSPSATKKLGVTAGSSFSGNGPIASSILGSAGAGARLGAGGAAGSTLSRLLGTGNTASYLNRVPSKTSSAPQSNRVTSAPTRSTYVAPTYGISSKAKTYGGSKNAGARKPEGWINPATYNATPTANTSASAKRVSGRGYSTAYQPRYNSATFGKSSFGGREMTTEDYLREIEKQRARDEKRMMDLAYSRVDPEIERQRSEAMKELMNYLASSGGMRIGDKNVRQQEVMDLYNRRRQEMAQPIYQAGMDAMSPYYDQLLTDYVQSGFNDYIDPVAITKMFF